MDDFERLLNAERISVERFVRFRLHSKEDADDVLQEVYLAAYQKFAQLKNRDSFKAWLISIARNKCNDHYRKKAALFEIPIDELTEKELSDGRHGIEGRSCGGGITGMTGRWTDTEKGGASSFRKTKDSRSMAILTYIGMIALRIISSDSVQEHF